MIAKLTGILDDFGPDWAVIDVNGVGYLVFCSGRTLTALGIRGDACTVYTEMQVSETDMRLIGFTSAGERAWFKLLTVVQGVGSKVALAILSALTVEELQRACAGGDAAMVARANGVGPKLAARIVNELKDKAGALPAGPAGAAVSAGVSLPEGNVAGDVVSALQNLGFKPNIAASAADAAIAELGEEAGVSALIRVALKKASA
ncbi:Holliday junction branch migration protein RuvA [Novosphingobium sediminicola]|uniref:Holliday junction branch migration complex subunit RuvA n=1 Tax=Novosphingobium sediminicola TaxID=563162 RepID=A0A7W6G888_9SPHN|nr:Holliday junction branch migration protein RuvA [Novosphingobium sediminicola]MBB3956980.1 Holliday junction DNA helicase RuvA [Novosphingobium sediminicola]